MKNVSIRMRILSGVVIVQLLGTIAVVIYLHQSYSGALDVTAQRSVKLSSAAWNDILENSGEKVDVTSLESVSGGYLERMKAITGIDYGLLVDKSTLNADEYAKFRESKGLANNWTERDTYVLVSATSDAAAEKMRFGATPESVPEMGKVVGIENGSCSRTCHGSMRQDGDYWRVTWSTDSNSRAHAVIPVADASGKPIGVLYSVEDITAQANSAKSLLIKTLLVIGLTLIVATLVIGGLLDTLVFKRLARMIHSMEDLSVRVAGGDFDAHFVPDGTSDEIGKFEQFFAKFLDLVSATLKSMVER